MSSYMAKVASPSTRAWWALPAVLGERRVHEPLQAEVLVLEGVDHLVEEEDLLVGAAIAADDQQRPVAPVVEPAGLLVHHRGDHLLQVDARRQEPEGLERRRLLGERPVGDLVPEVPVDDPGDHRRPGLGGVHRVEEGQVAHRRGALRHLGDHRRVLAGQGAARGTRRERGQGLRRRLPGAGLRGRGRRRAGGARGGATGGEEDAAARAARATRGRGAGDGMRASPG